MGNRASWLPIRGARLPTARSGARSAGTPIFAFVRKRLQVVRKRLQVQLPWGFGQRSWHAPILRLTRWFRAHHAGDTANRGMFCEANCKLLSTPPNIRSLSADGVIKGLSATNQGDDHSGPINAFVGGISPGEA